MTSSLTDTLCTRCGLCCDGSLFADVELSGPGEATGLEILGVEVEAGDAGGSLLLQPCAALQGRRCGIYPHRPQCCRTFECRLLQDVRRGTRSLQRARELVAETLEGIRGVQALLRQLGRGRDPLPLGELVAEALSGQPGSSPGADRKRTELESRMSALDALVRRTFLG